MERGGFMEHTATLSRILCNAKPTTTPHDKKVFTERAWIHSHGLETEQGDKTYYPDPDCALLHYAWEHYAFWRDKYPDRAALFDAPGIFGENFSTQGMTEQSVCPGDIFKVGTALLQVSWGRIACNTMAGRLDDDAAPALMHAQSRNGWFYRVLQEGEVYAGARFELLERPYGQWSLSRVQDIIFDLAASREALEAVYQIDTLSNTWREQIRDRLALLDPR